MVIKETKHKSLSLDKSIDIRNVFGKKVLTKEGKNIGKIRTIRIDPKDLTIEGIEVDTGLFKIDQYFGKNYIKTITEQGAILKITPIDDIIGHSVYDSTGKRVGEIKKIKRSKKTNKLLSVTIYSDLYKEDVTIDADYIATCGESCILKEPIKDIID